MNRLAKPRHEMRLYNEAKERLYINAGERKRFIAAAKEAPLLARVFCLVLLYTGCRISEALELTHGSLQRDARLVTYRTLKRRDKLVMREVPMPPQLIEALDAIGALDQDKPAGQSIWETQRRAPNRTTAYRWVKSVMSEAGIVGAQASPKGLRHGFGIHAIRCGMPLNMLSKWMGHASMTTTAIYANAIGEEEMAIADKMWVETPPLALNGQNLSAAVRMALLDILANSEDDLLRQFGDHPRAGAQSVP